MVENFEIAKKHKTKGKNPSGSQSHHADIKDLLNYC